MLLLLLLPISAAQMLNRCCGWQQQMGGLI